jgi:hypothetical protein
MTDARLIAGIAVIMRECWDLPSDLQKGELQGYAAELLRRIRLGDNDVALEFHIAEVQAHSLQIPPSKAYRRIVARAIALVGKSK